MTTDEIIQEVQRLREVETELYSKVTEARNKYDALCAQWTPVFERIRALTNALEVMTEPTTQSAIAECAKEVA